jgi:DNA-binding MarR family transcriptional regulator
MPRVHEPSVRTTEEEPARQTKIRKYNFINYLPYHLTFPVGTVSRVLSNAIYVRFGLKSAHWRIMSLLGSRGHVSTRELANYLSTEKSAISRATSELIAQGYLLRVANPIDRRLVMLHLSSRGKRLFEQMSAVALDFEEALLKSVSSEDIAVLDRCLAKLRQAALDYQKANKLQKRPGDLADVDDDLGNVEPRNADRRQRRPRRR